MTATPEDDILFALRTLDSGEALDASTFESLPTTILAICSEGDGRLLERAAQLLDEAITHRADGYELYALHCERLAGGCHDALPLRWQWRIPASIVEQAYELATEGLDGSVLSDAAYDTMRERLATSFARRLYNDGACES